MILALAEPVFQQGSPVLLSSFWWDHRCSTLPKRKASRKKSDPAVLCVMCKAVPAAVMLSALSFSSDQSSSYYEFLGVSSCQDVLHLYRLLWSSTVLNIIGLFLGIITAAILGAFKDMVRLTVLCLRATSRKALVRAFCLLALSN